MENPHVWGTVRTRGVESLFTPCPPGSPLQVYRESVRRTGPRPTDRGKGTNGPVSTIRLEGPETGETRPVEEGTGLASRLGAGPPSREGVEVQGRRGSEEGIESCYYQRHQNHQRQRQEHGVTGGAGDRTHTSGPRRRSALTSPLSQPCEPSTAPHGTVSMSL